MARHLVARQGVRHLLLCSRTGRADALEQELVAAGACVRVAACDVSDRAALGALLAGIHAAHPLTAIIHTAGVIDDGVFEAMSLAAHRPGVCAEGRCGLASARADQGPTSLLHSCCSLRRLACWGQPAKPTMRRRTRSWMRWRITGARRGFRPARCSGATGRERSWLTGHLGTADIGRMSRGGIAALSSEDGLSLLDVALGAGAAAAGAHAAGPAQPCWRGREPAAAVAGTGAGKRPSIWGHARPC